MTRRGASIRAAAIRRAQQAKAQRDAERLAQEQEIEAALADYFEAASRAAAIRAEARRKADKTLADAEAAARPAEAAGRAAVHRLRALTGSHADVAELCGLTSAAVRALLREDSTQPAAHCQAQAAVPEGAGQAGNPHPAQEQG
jgi:hypothetical protein